MSGELSARKTGFAEVNSARLFYEDSADLDSPHTVVFVHAGVADNRLWDAQVTAFAHKYRVIRYDMRAYGQSEPVEGDYTNLADLTALLDDLKVDKAHLVGCSMGGMTCMDYTLIHPEKVVSLTMVGAGPDGLELDIPDLPIFAEAEAAAEAKDWEKLLEIETRIWFDGIGRTPEQVDPEKRAVAMDMNRIAFDHYFKGLGKRQRNLENMAAGRLGEITVPVLSIVGQYDIPYQHAAADYMAEHIKNCRKVVMNDTAHLPSMEQPEAFNRILADFLDEQV